MSRAAHIAYDSSARPIPGRRSDICCRKYSGASYAAPCERATGVRQQQITHASLRALIRVAASMRMPARDGEKATQARGGNTRAHVALLLLRCLLRKMSQHAMPARHVHAKTRRLKRDGYVWRRCTRRAAYAREGHVVLKTALLLLMLPLRAKAEPRARRPCHAICAPFFRPSSHMAALRARRRFIRICHAQRGKERVNAADAVTPSTRNKGDI